jgi:DNA polymerase-3 subunit epsilon
MREIVLDTETTGLDPATGHRVVEIGGVELLNHMPTGRTYQSYLNPERDMPVEAYEVHGLSGEFLADKPKFAEIVTAFLDFIGDAALVIHNASFDIKFLSAELAAVGQEPLPPERAIDTLEIARRKFPGAPNSLDALCRRFGVDLEGRDKHGALLDCELLARVYLEMVGGRQPGLALSSARTTPSEKVTEASPAMARPPRPHAPTADELETHRAFIAGLKQPIWNS